MSRNEKIFLGVIPARGGSKGILRKNIKKLAGKPLIQYTFDAAKNSKLLDRFIVSTDDSEIIEYSKDQGVEVPFKRPEELATDTSKTLDVLIHALNFLKKEEDYQPNYVVILQPTSPMRNEEDIDRSIEIISNNGEADSLVSVIEVPHNFNPYSVMKFDGQYLSHYITDKRIMIRQQKPKFYARNGAAIYITKVDLLMIEKKIIGENCLPYFMPKERSIDIDDEFDWKIAELLIKNE